MDDGSSDTKSTMMRKPIWLKIFGHDITAPLLLLILSLLLFVPGQWTVPPLDRDEPRYTQATKQMLETGDYIDIRFQEQARHKKPVGIYWLQAAAVKLTGHDAEAPLWVYRLPSLIGAVFCVFAAFWMARAFMGPAGAVIVAGFVALSIIVGVEPELAYQAALNTARDLGWKIGTESESAGMFEATDTTFWYGFKDDVVVRVTALEEGGSRIDARSVSRVGVSDLGANAARISRFEERLRASLGEGA